MTTTAEQLQAWREAFEAATASTPMLSILFYQKNDDGKYANHTVEAEWRGYLRRCQETEQAIKDARKDALQDAFDALSSLKDPKKYLLSEMELLK